MRPPDCMENARRVLAVWLWVEVDTGRGAAPVPGRRAWTWFPNWAEPLCVAVFGVCAASRPSRALRVLAAERVDSLPTLPASGAKTEPGAGFSAGVSVRTAGADSPSAAV